MSRLGFLQVLPCVLARRARTCMKVTVLVDLLTGADAIFDPVHRDISDGRRQTKPRRVRAQICSGSCVLEGASRELAMRPPCVLNCAYDQISTVCRCCWLPLAGPRAAVGATRPPKQGFGLNYSAPRPRARVSISISVRQGPDAGFHFMCSVF